MHIKFLSISEVAARERHDFISNWGKQFPHWSGMTVSTRDRLHNSSFFSNQHTHYQIDFALFINNGGRIWKQIDSNTTSTSSSASASVVSADWDITPPLWKVRVDTQYVGIIEEQKHQTKQLQEELAEFNHVQNRTLPANASRGENVLMTSKKVIMTATDHINQQAVASYLREAIWPGNIMLPNSWSKWRDDKRSLCQMILKTVALPVGVDGKSY